MKKSFGGLTAFSLVVGSMVGTGVFVSLGYQLMEFESGFSLMFIWVVGGLCAFCGAVAYCELAAAIPRSGGEYTFLRETFHPAIGFIAGWISITTGFSAPAALTAVAFGSYLHAAASWIDPKVAGIGLILVLTALHAYSHRSSGSMHSSFTVAKIFLILFFCAAAWWLVESPQQLSFTPSSIDLGIVTSGGFAVSLIYVNYAFAGWNATIYVIEELNQPTKTVNRALMLGTAVVLVLYLLLNATFLGVAPVESMKGATEVGYVAAAAVFDEVGALLMSLMVAFVLISTLSGLVLAGPRVLSKIGTDFPSLAVLAKKNRHDVPSLAICIQSLIAIGLILTSTFDAILLLSGVLLGVSGFGCVSASIWRRLRHGPPQQYRMPLFPLPPLIFLFVTGWAVLYAFAERPLVGTIAIGTIVLGMGLYFVASRLDHAKK